MPGGVEVHRRGPVVLWVIDRPGVRNALDPGALDALTEAIDAATADRQVGAAVLTGAGQRCFSSGMDLRSLRSDRVAVGAAVRRFHAAMRSAERLPIVAAVRGMAVGGGFELMTMCDLVVASDDATFALPEVRRGLVPAGGATLLPARLPLPVAMELVLLGEPFDAERAQSLGLVNRVRPTGEVVDEAVRIAEQLAANPPATMARVRHLLWTTATQGPAASTEVARSGADDPRLAEESATGMAEFLDPS